jgi:hypothetical protein
MTVSSNQVCLPRAIRKGNHILSDELVEGVIIKLDAFPSAGALHVLEQIDRGIVGVPYRAVPDSPNDLLEPVRRQKSIAQGIRTLGIEELPKRVSAEESGTAVRTQVWVQHQTLIAASSKGFSSTKSFFRQPPASRIDDANHRCA